MTKLAGLAFLGFVLGCPGAPVVALAPVEALPDAAAILDKYVEVTGGREAYEAIHNSVSKMRLVHVEMGFEDSVVEYQARPNKRYTIIESDALGEVRQGTDGNVVWYLSEQTGPLVEEGEARSAGLDGAAVDRTVQWRDYYSKVECVGEEEVEGKSCYKIVMTPNHGEPETRYYDQESGLLVKAKKARLSSHMPTMWAELSVSDYRWVDGLLIPHKLRHESQMCGGKREMLFVTESIEHNVELPSDRFDPPEEVRALAGKERGSSWGEFIRSAVLGADGRDSKGGSRCCGSAQKNSAGQEGVPKGCGGGS